MLQKFGVIYRQKKEKLRKLFFGNKLETFVIKFSLIWTISESIPKSIRPKVEIYFEYFKCNIQKRERLYTHRGFVLIIQVIMVWCSHKMSIIISIFILKRRMIYYSPAPWIVNLSTQTTLFKIEPYFCLTVICFICGIPRKYSHKTNSIQKTKIRCQNQKFQMIFLMNPLRLIQW